MSLVLEPWSLQQVSVIVTDNHRSNTHSSRDMISGTLAPDPHQDLQAGQLQPPGVVWAKRTREGFENFKTLRVWLDDDFSFWLRLRYRWWVEGSPAGSESF